jgi:hypothetical protein
MLIFLAVIYRFGFGNILMVMREAESAKQSSATKTLGESRTATERRKGITQTCTIIVMFISSIILVSMGNYTNVHKYGLIMYVLLFILHVVDVANDVVSRYIGLDKRSFKYAWLINKVLWLMAFVVTYFIFDHFVHINFWPTGAIRDMSPSGSTEAGFYWLLICITTGSSLYSFARGREVFFPFVTSDAVSHLDRSNPGHSVSLDCHVGVARTCDYTISYVPVARTGSAVVPRRVAKPLPNTAAPWLSE